jgi:transposase-like protein
VPLFEKRWGLDETSLKIRGQWVYLYRAVDKAGRTVDFLLSRRRDMAAAKRFFSRANEAAWSSEGDHAGWLRRLAPGVR